MIARSKSFALGIGLLCAAVVLAQGRASRSYDQEWQQIEDRYQDATTVCSVLAGELEEMCRTHAAGMLRVAAAQLEARHDPTAQNHYEVRIAEAEAAHANAQQQCDTMTGDAREVCLDEAAAAQATATADAQAWLATNETGTATPAGEVHDAVARQNCERTGDNAREPCRNPARLIPASF